MGTIIENNGKCKCRIIISDSCSLRDLCDIPEGKSEEERLLAVGLLPSSFNMKTFTHFIGVKEV